MKSDKQILFVLTGNNKAEDVLGLCAAIELYTKNYKILYTPWINKPNYISNSILERNERIIVRPIIYEKYPGNLKSWEKAFENIGFQNPS